MGGNTKKEVGLEHGVRWSMFPMDHEMGVSWDYNPVRYNAQIHDLLINKYPVAGQGPANHSQKKNIHDIPRSVSGDIVVLLSGGMDSVVTLHIGALLLLREFYPNDTGELVGTKSPPAIHCLSFDYGQNHEHELSAARYQARKFNAYHKTIRVDSCIWGPPMSYYRDKDDSLTLSALVHEDVEVPEDREVSEMSQGIPLTYVPARNMLFLAHAVAYAEVIGASDIFCGVNAVDYSGYPDCRPEFIRQFQDTAEVATKAGVEFLEDTEGGRDLQIHTPLINWTKKDIVQVGTALGVDFAKTHTCYNPDKDGRACGRCDACKLRLEAFEASNRADPAPYQRYQQVV